MDQAPLKEIIDYEHGDISDSDEKSPLPSQPSKFVIIASQQQISLVYGPVSDYPYHADLVKRFCEANEIPSGWIKKPDIYEIFGDSHRVRGGGWVEAGGDNAELKFYGFSTTYGGFSTEDILYLYCDQVAENGLILSFNA